jgi:hypothetical protein
MISLATGAVLCGCRRSFAFSPACAIVNPFDPIKLVAEVAEIEIEHGRV